MLNFDKDMITKAYGRWAPVYDLVFGAVFERGRQAAIAAAERIGGRILEVGVGTGISLPDYKRTNRLCGVDISEPMLRKAQERVTELGLSQCRRALGHGRRASDVSGCVVRRGRGAVCRDHGAQSRSHARRICPRARSPAARSSWSAASARRPGCAGRSNNGFAPAARKLGWRTEFPFERYLRWAERTTASSN